MKPDFSSDPMNTQGDVTQGGGMMKRMIARNGPVRGTKRIFCYFAETRSHQAWRRKEPECEEGIRFTQGVRDAALLQLRREPDHEPAVAEP
jgi:hypothetical protein